MIHLMLALKPKARFYRLEQGWATSLALRATLKTIKVSPGQYMFMWTNFEVVLLDKVDIFLLFIVFSKSK
jgi:hypothetical protein